MSNELESDSAMVVNLESFGVDGAGYDETELWKGLNNRKCGSAPRTPRGDGKFVDFYKAMRAPLEGGSGRGLTKLLEVVQRIWRCEKVEESWLVGKLRLLPKSGDLSIPNNWRGITLLAVIAKLFCSVLSNRIYIYSRYRPIYKN